MTIMTAIILVNAVVGHLNFTSDRVTYIIKNGTVWVMEDGSLPYETDTSHVLVPPPNASVTSVLQSKSSIFLFTDNNYEWMYQRFKLRRVYYNSASVAFKVLPLLLKIKICSCLLKL